MISGRTDGWDSVDTVLVIPLSLLFSLGYGHFATHAYAEAMFNIIQ